MKFAQIGAALVEVDALDIVVEPHFAPAEGGAAVGFERDAMDIKSGEEVALRAAPFDGELGEGLLEEDAAELRVGFERHLDGFGFAVGVGAEIVDFRAGGTGGEVVLTLVGKARHVEALDVESALFAIAIGHIVDGALVVLLKHRDVDNLGLPFLGLGTFRLSNIDLFGHTRHLVGAIAIEDDDVVDVGTVVDKFVLFQGSSHKSIGPIDVEFFIGLHHFGRLNGVERSHFREARVVGGIMVEDVLKPADGDVGHVGQVVLDFGDFGLDARNEFVGLGLVELQDAGHLDFEQTKQVVASDFTHEILFERFESGVDVRESGFEMGGILISLVLIDALIDEDALKRGKHHAFEEFATTDFQLTAKQFLGVFDIRLEHLAHRDKTWLVVVDDAAVGRNAHLAIGEGIECIDGLVARHAGRQVDEDFHLFGSEILNLPNFDASLFGRFLDAFAEGVHRFSIGKFGDGNRFAVALFDARPHLHTASTETVVVLENIYQTARLEVGIDLKRLSTQVVDGRLTEFAKIVRKDFGTEPDGNAFRSLSKKEGKFDRERYRFFVAPIVG